MERIEFGELHIGDIAKEHIQDCLDTDWLTAGPKVQMLEEQWSNLFKYKHSITMSSGTDADINACLALHDLPHVRRGDEVIVPALAFIATANAVLAAGFTPVFVDIEKETLNIDPSKIEDAITDRTVAIMAVHTMGRPCDMRHIGQIADQNNLIVIEDACEAHGASFQGTTIGHWGHLSTFSFYVAHLICTTEGGMVSTNVDWIAEALRSTKSHGRQPGVAFFNHIRHGINSKMTDLQASIGLEGVSMFQQVFAKRKAYYDRILQFCQQYKDRVWLSEEDDGNLNCPHGISITTKDKDISKLIASFEKHKIHWKRNFGCISTQHRALSFMNHSHGDFPNAEWVGSYGIHIGCHQYLTEDDIDRILLAIKIGLS